MFYPRWLPSPEFPLPASNTQAVISYVAPNSNACTLKVTGSPSYSPLLEDVDESLYTGSSLDSRTDNYSAGVYRVFVAGKRKADLASDGEHHLEGLVPPAPISGRS